MKQNSKLLKLTLNGKRMTGSMLLEVVLAIAVFAFGMLALVQLQGNLTRSSADANERTAATNIAEEIIENIRGFTQVDPVADPDEWGYLELVGTALDQTVVKGLKLKEYTVTAEITDFWRDGVNDTFISKAATDPPVAPVGATGGAAYAAFKLLKINVAWNTNAEFYVDDENTAVLGDNDITIYEIIPSSPPILGAKIAADPNAPAGTPLVDYTPGLNPDIVPIDLLNGERLKESTTPIPDIIRSGELTETSFDVVTYNTVNSNNFLRREEFVTVGCKCTLRTRVDAGQGGLRPTVWNGVEYSEGEFIAKNFGEGASNQQSVFCDVCCADHHEGGNGDTGGYEVERLVYDPWADSISAGTDHNHYNRSKKGELTLATKDGDEYVEACRLIRKDGFFRVAHDFNKRGFFGFAADYLDHDFEIEEYSDYLIDAVNDLYENKGQKDLKQPGDDNNFTFTNPATGVPGPKLPASTVDTPTNLPLLVAPFSIEQQLRSRGVYIDYLTDEVRAKIQACADAPDTCPLPGYTTATELEVFYPFFEVQLTSLATWREEIPNVPVHVTDDPIETDNTHSRGLAKLMTDEGNESTVFLEIQEGNVGIAAIDPIVPSVAPGPLAAAAASTAQSNVFVATTGTPTDYPGTRINGEISSGVGGVQAADVAISFNEAQCGRTSTGYTCIFPPQANGPTLTVSNYYKANKNLYACSDGMDIALNGQVTGVDASTTFDLSTAVSGQADIVIQDTPCN